MDVKSRLKEYEGSQVYQQKLGYYRNGKFWIYKDSLQKDTVAYGHLVLPGENFSNGLTEHEADALLDRDIAIARGQLSKLNISVPDDWSDFLLIMLFQLGLGGVQKFRGMLQALREQNYPRAVIEARDSLWYRQTPNRVNQMVAVLTNK